MVIVWESRMEDVDGEALPFYRCTKEGTVMMEYNEVWCLFCTTGKESSVAERIHEKGWGRAIFPQRVKTIRRNREWTEQSAPLLPGYVFMYMQQRKTNRVELEKLLGVIRVLDYSEPGESTLLGRDREFADWLWHFDGKIGTMQALQVGDRIEIIDGAFRALNGTILRMDRRRQTFLVSLDTEGVIRKVWLTYEVVEKRKK